MTIRELMTTDVRTVAPDTPLKDVAELLVRHGISGLPVCDADGSVLGVVSESDILAKEGGRRNGPSGVLAWFVGSAEAEVAKAKARTAGEAMTSPAITIAPHRPTAAAARLMLDERINRLPVVDLQDKLVGIVTRADLVKAFTRSDELIAREIREAVVYRAIWAEPTSVQVEVHEGKVRLTGKLEQETDAELLVSLTERVPGVVSVESEVGFRHETPRR